jgi:hypothetical protein
MRFVLFSAVGRARSIHAFAVAALALACGTAFAQSKADPQAYPTRPVRIILPNTAGSAMDVVTRMISQRLTEVWARGTRRAHGSGDASRLSVHDVVRDARPARDTAGDPEARQCRAHENAHRPRVREEAERSGTGPAAGHARRVDNLFMRAETDRFAKVVKAAGLLVQ